MIETDDPSGNSLENDKLTLKGSLKDAATPYQDLVASIRPNAVAEALSHHRQMLEFMRPNAIAEALSHHRQMIEFIRPNAIAEALSHHRKMMEFIRPNAIAEALSHHRQMMEFIRPNAIAEAMRSHFHLAEILRPPSTEEKFLNLQIPELTGSRILLEQIASQQKSLSKMTFLAATSLENVQVTSFAKLQVFRELGNIANLIRLTNSFEADAASILRTELGDWRGEENSTNQPKSDSNCPSIYLERGFSPEISRSSSIVVGGILDIVGIKFELVSIENSRLTETSNLILPSQLNEREIARKKLDDFEFKVRNFIESRMTSEFGTNWVSSNLPPQMRDSWTEKLEKHRKGNASNFRLIDFADFTDYSRIITNRKNFPAFAAFFHRIENIRESFNRLEPCRLALCHGRDMSTEEYTFFCTEIARIEWQIGKLYLA